MTEHEIIDVKPKGIAEYNPADTVKYWDKEFINARIDQIDNQTHKVFFFLLWRTGVRVSEALGIEKQHLNFDDHEITIRWLKKRKAQTRKLPMHKDLKNILGIYTHKMKYNERIFPFTRQYADKIAKKYFQGNCHKFRHSFAVAWLKSGVDLYQLSKMLGHSSVKVTEMYLQVTTIDIGKELHKVEF